MSKLKDLLIEYGCPDNANYTEDSFNSDGHTYKQLRDKLMMIGTILEEYENDHTYLISVRVNYNHATIAIQLRGGKLTLVAYAKEGLLKQNTAQNAIDNIKKALVLEEAVVPKKKSKYIIFSILIIAVIGISLLVSSIVACNAISKYNIAAETFNALVERYNSAVSKTSVDNIDGVPSAVEKINIEDDSIREGISVVFGKNSISKINQDTETIYSLVSQLENSLNIIEQITSPSGEWIEKRIKGVEGVTGTQAVTEDNNPDGLLGKDGGYIACIYFTYDKIAEDSVIGDSIVAKGTDAGGAIEIYSSLEDAEARCEYLSGFDGTVLYSGSYAIVGTTVIRTSYLLSNEEQFDLTDRITQAITKQ